MKKIFFFGIVFIGLFATSQGYGADEVVTSPGKPLIIEEFVGADDAFLEPTMFPEFYGDTSDNPGCATTNVSGVCNNVSGQDRWTPTIVYGNSWSVNRYPYYDTLGRDECSFKINGFCNFSNCAQSMRTCDGSGNCINIYMPCKENGYYDNGKPIASTENLAKGEYQNIPGLEGTIKLAGNYRNITEILFTWTVRLEGSSRLIEVWPYICHPHHSGTSYQRFPAGPLKTRLYVRSNAPGNGVKNVDTGDYVEDRFVPVGQIIEMTVPSAGDGKVSNPGDPTITGSYALLPSDFQKEKVARNVDFEVRWYNETSMRIKSPANQRNLITTVFPVTNQKSEEE